MIREVIVGLVPDVGEISREQTGFCGTYRLAVALPSNRDSFN